MPIATSAGVNLTAPALYQKLTVKSMEEARKRW
jgi:hypothetical protein